MAAFVGFLAAEFGKWAIGEMLVSTAVENSTAAAATYEALGFAGELAGEATTTAFAEAGSIGVHTEVGVELAESGAILNGSSVEAGALGNSFSTPLAEARAADALAGITERQAAAGAAGRATAQTAFKTAVGHTVVVRGSDAITHARKLMKSNNAHISWIGEDENKENGGPTIYQHKLLKEYRKGAKLNVTPHGPPPFAGGDVTHRRSTHASGKHVTLNKKRKPRPKPKSSKSSKKSSKKKTVQATKLKRSKSRAPPKRASRDTGKLRINRMPAYGEGRWALQRTTAGFRAAQREPP